MKTRLGSAIVLLVPVVIAAVALSYFRPVRPGVPVPGGSGGDGVVCTQDAKQCPDGSYVGRIAPKCEFAPCPTDTGVSTSTAKLAHVVMVRGLFLAPLEVLEDSRCPADVTCIQAGTVRVRANVEMNGNRKEIIFKLGESNVFADKSIELVNVQPAKSSKQNILPADWRFEFVVKDQAEVNAGMLEGQMTIGPVCPVERIDNPCKPTPEMFASRKVFVYGSDQKTLVATLTPNANGNFSVTLPVGNYYVDLAEPRSSVGSVTGVPKNIVIEKGKTVILNIVVDTGIR